MSIKILNIKGTTFNNFGKTLVPSIGAIPEVYEDNIFKFYVTFKEQANSWQIGYLDQVGKKVEKLECHPNTSEVFIPLSGVTALLISNDPQKDIFAFKLNEPIVINKGVWHGVISLTKSAKILVVESTDVIDQYYDLNVPIDNNNLINL
jgi:ureidoglycolate hydrolase